MDQALDPQNPHAHASLRDKVVVITGGSQGLGNAVAQLAKARGAGGLLLVGRDASKGQAAAAALDGDGCRCVFLASDLGTSDGVAAVIERVDAEFGSAHALAHCAAATWRGSVWNTTGDMWDDMLALNVKASGLLISGLAHLMRREGVAGSLALVGSIAHHGAIGELFPYVASKHALEAMVRHAAYSLRTERIRVNLINPGWMDTPAEHEIQKRFHGAGDDWLQIAEAQQPFGRILKPQEVARGICFMLSDESGMMTGASIDFDQTIPGQGPSAPPDAVPLSFPWEDA